MFQTFRKVEFCVFDQVFNDVTARFNIPYNHSTIIADSVTEANTAAQIPCNMIQNQVKCLRLKKNHDFFFFFSGNIL